MLSTANCARQMPTFYNMASEPCITDGNHMSTQLLMRNYLLAAGNASLAHYSQVRPLRQG